MALYRLGDLVPRIHPDAYVHPEAVVIGSVTLAPGSSVWPAAVLRGDYGEISVGAETSIQDGCIVHATAELPTRIGARCVVGHAAHLEGCVVEDDCLIGSGSVLLHRVTVGAGSLVGAGAVVSPGTEIPPRSRALGVPARVTEGVSDPVQFRGSVDRYLANAARYRQELHRID
jgi:carbonic anhydrase/acetyltransferase-like protein (isoleucine patch superfamily)